ncbi:hypothetical protein [Bacteroides zoogleoformans]|uniref:Uncharacterized protein n=1 Tax=Bacteroides zoogleoformans TaxID=28119 RepID=A0ABM6T816_9BACE|nr:hypothetical protein [Bacteroides zoogleoformans]AVM52795.1 hypothetical protein C4H11_07475 [Bacteroides zoogleoformans]
MTYAAQDITAGGAKRRWEVAGDDIGKSRATTLGSHRQRHWEVTGNDIGKSQATTLGSHRQRHWEVTGNDIRERPAASYIRRH